MSQYSDAVKRLPSAVEEVSRLPCRWCQMPTLIATLNQYGARCHICYEAYCAEPPQSAPKMADKRKDGDRAWASVLKTRHESGEKLTGAQIAMYRAVIERLA